jgi:hypothetical protein
MATYLQGVQDYIPQIQPAQPDFNFYNTVLATKQSQYDTNFKKLNKLYGQIYYADLTREGNVEKREKLVKDIDFNLKRIAGMDLSLEQNMTQATQLFKPFYEDKVLVKDMAWTKNYMNQRSRAEGMKNSSNKELRDQYWNTGVRAMDYMREEFAATSDEESMNFRNASYTPYTNVMKLADEIAKSFGDIQSAPKIGSQWIIKQTNGKPLQDILTKVFESRLGNDPAIQAIYQTQAYVDRKDYSYTNAAQFGGDKDAAEMDYLKKNYDMLVKMNNAEKAELNENISVSEARQKDVEDRAKDNNSRPDAEAYLESVLQSLNVNTTLYKRAENLSDELGTGSATSSTTTGFVNPYSDIASLRRKVDAGMASALMKKDLGEAALIYGLRNSKTDIVANPYGVMRAKHQNDLAAIKAKKLADEENIALEHGLETGALRYNYKTKTYEINPDVEFSAHETINDGASPSTDIYEFGKKGLGQQFEGGVTEEEIMTTQVKVMDPSGKTTKFVDASLAGMYDQAGLLIKDSDGQPTTQQRLVKKKVVTGGKAYLTEVMKLGHNLISENKLTEQEFLAWFDPSLSDDPYYEFKSSGGMAGYNPPKKTGMETLAALRPKNALDELMLKRRKGLLKEQLVNGKIYEKLKVDGINAVEDLIEMINNDASGNDPNFFGDVYTRVRNFTKTHMDLKTVEDAVQALETTGVAAKDFQMQYNNWQDWKQNFNREIKRELKVKLGDDFDPRVINDLFTADGDIISEEQYKRLSIPYKRKGSTMVIGAPLYALNSGIEAEDEEDMMVTSQDFKPYEEAWKVLNKLRKSDKVYTRMNDAPGIPGVLTPGAGIESTASSIIVAPRAIGTKGQMVFEKFIRDLNSLDIDGDKALFTLNGANIDAINDSKESIEDSDEENPSHSQIGEMILNNYISQVQGSNDKIDPIKMMAQTVAGGDATKGAYKFFFDKEYLDKFTGTTNNPGILTDAQVTNLMSNGLTLVADNDHSIFKSPLIKFHLDPVSSEVEYNGSYTYEDPRGNGRFMVDKDPNYPSGYKVTLEGRIWNPEENRYESMVEYMDNTFNQNLTLLRNEQAINNMFPYLDRRNIELKNGN